MGRVLSRWAIAEGFYYFDSFQNHYAMGLLQLEMMFVFFFFEGGYSR